MYSTYGACPAHPRAGGENPFARAYCACPSGSSPRGRGKRGVDGRAESLIGLIPARAGKTQDSPPAGGGSRAHPRAGGENWAKSALVRTSVGSSPRGRGKRPPVYPAGHARGLIPARAGKTSGDRRRTRRSPAHPRAGGENLTGRQGLGKSWGSSPRGRGKRA